MGFTPLPPPLPSPLWATGLQNRENSELPEMSLLPLCIFKIDVYIYVYIYFEDNASGSLGKSFSCLHRSMPWDMSPPACFLCWPWLLSAMLWMLIHPAGVGNICWKHISSLQVCYCTWIMERWREWIVWSSGQGHRAKFSQYESAVTPPAPAEWIGVTRSFSWRKSLFTPAWVRGASAQRAPPLPSQRVSVGILNPAALRGPPPRSGSPKPQKRTLLESPTDTSERGLENHITCIQRGGLALPRAVVSHHHGPASNSC